MLKTKNRFTYYIFLVFLPALIVSCSKQNTDETSTKNFNESTIDSLIIESKQFYRKNKDSIPVFDGILMKAYDLANQDNNTIKIGEIFIILGKRQRNASEFAKAISYYQQAIAISKKINNDELHANAAHELAVVFRRINDNAQAHRLYIESLEWAESANDSFLIHCSLNGIGNVHYNYKDYKQAIEYFHQSLMYLGKRNRNLLGEAINTNTIGESWMFLGDTDSAMYYLNKSLSINKEIGSSLGQAICYNSIGMVYIKNHNNEQAIKAIKEALNIDNNTLEEIYQAMILANLGHAYLKNGNYKLSEETLNKAYNIASTNSYKYEAFDASTYLSELYQKTNRLSKSLEFMQICMAYKDSITDDLLKQHTSSISTLYKTEQQEREILILKQNAELDALKLKRQQNMIVSTFVFALIIVTFILAFYRQRRLSNMINQVELEQQLLRAQLNPHFIFNSLSALQTFFMNNDKLAASDYLANFSRLMRNILLGSRTDSISLDKELELLNDYLKLQQLRFNNTFDFKIEADTEIDTEECQVPPMLVQPFIENSIEHGMRDLEYKGLIIVHFKKVNNNLQIIVDDNGIGLNQTIIDNSKSKKQHESLATKITQERLQNLHRITKQKCSLNIINKADCSEQTGVKVTLTIPFKEQ